MNALVNAHTRNDDNLSPCTGLISNVLPEAQRSQTGVSSDYVHKKEYHGSVEKYWGCFFCFIVFCIFAL